MISRRRGLASIASLIDAGKLTPDQAGTYEQMVKQGVSYRDLMLSELGKVTGELYLREEEAQALVKLGLTLDLSKMSVPEILWIEDSVTAEPHHLERYSELPTKRKFEEECGEPWHPSLKEMFRPDRRVVLHFKGIDHQRDTARILKLAYGKR